MTVRFLIAIAAIAMFALYALDTSDSVAKCEQFHSRATCLNNLAR